MALLSLGAASCDAEGRLMQLVPSSDSARIAKFGQAVGRGYPFRPQRKTPSPRHAEDRWSPGMDDRNLPLLTAMKMIAVFVAVTIAFAILILVIG